MPSVTPLRLGRILTRSTERESRPIKNFPLIAFVAPNSGWIEVCGEVMNDDQSP